MAPGRRPQCAACKDRAVGRKVTQHDPLALAGEDHVMLTHHIPAPDGMDADLAFRAFAAWCDEVGANTLRDRVLSR